MEYISAAGQRTLRFDLNGYLKAHRHQIDQRLKTLLNSENNQDTGLVAAMTYSVKAGGKRLRPILCMAATHAVGGSEDDALLTGCALEMIHTYSLIHDDLPAMDDDDLRRGKPTCHKTFGEATAILAGDALLTRAFQLLAEHALAQPAAQQGLWIAVIALIAQAAGFEGMIEGQMRDIDAEGRALTAQQLERLHQLKTGALISASIEAGARIGEADQQSMARLREYGACVGLAFQVTDDILNEVGDPRVMGKAVGTDQRRMKSTYPALMGMTEAKQKAAALVNQALRSLDIFDKKSDPLRAIAQYVLQRQR